MVPHLTIERAAAAVGPYEPHVAPSVMIKRLISICDLPTVEAIEVAGILRRRADQARLAAQQYEIHLAGADVRGR